MPVRRLTSKNYSRTISSPALQRLNNSLLSQPSRLEENVILLRPNSIDKKRKVTKATKHAISVAILLARNIEGRVHFERLHVTVVRNEVNLPNVVTHQNNV